MIISTQALSFGPLALSLTSSPLAIDHGLLNLYKLTLPHVLSEIYLPFNQSIVINQLDGRYLGLSGP